MIIDTILNSEKYNPVHPLFVKVFDFLKNKNLKDLQPGIFQIAEDIQIIVSEKKGLKRQQAKFEAHNLYIDIQICLSGEETFGWKSRSTCKNIEVDYNTGKDVIFFRDAPDTYFQLHEGQFAVFFPEDVHAPMIGDGLVKKLVAKLKLVKG